MEAHVAQNYVDHFGRVYPGAPVFRIPEQDPLEIVVEVEKTSNQSIAVAIIERSAPHFHRNMIETYLVETGPLTLHVDGETYVLQKGDVFIIRPGQVHWAEGNRVRVKVVASPAWTPEDHILAE